MQKKEHKPASLRKQAIAAPKYILLLEGFPTEAYLADTKEFSLTDKKEEAMQYSIGFDNEVIKTGYWTAIARKVIGDDSITFKRVDL